jgi:hypothetical protein
MLAMARNPTIDFTSVFIDLVFVVVVDLVNPEAGYNHAFAGV